MKIITFIAGCLASVRASCPDGSIGDDRICEDIDECEDGLHSCGPNESCHNYWSSYQCVRYVPWTTKPPMTNCPSGSTRIDTPWWFNLKCEDVNECENGEHDCFSHQECINFWGGYRCEESDSKTMKEPTTTTVTSTTTVTTTTTITTTTITQTTKTTRTTATSRTTLTRTTATIPATATTETTRTTATSRTTTTRITATIPVTETTKTTRTTRTTRTTATTKTRTTVTSNVTATSKTEAVNIWIIIGALNDSIFFIALTFLFIYCYKKEKRSRVMQEVKHDISRKSTAIYEEPYERNIFDNAYRDQNSQHVQYNDSFNEDQIV